jgi:hypothetical protein
LDASALLYLALQQFLWKEELEALVVGWLVQIVLVLKEVN